MKHLAKLFVLLMAVTLVGACSNSGGGEGDGEKTAKKEATAKDFAQQMCDLAIKGDGEKFIELFHPKVLEAQAKETGQDVEESKKMMIDTLSKMHPESCEVIKVEEGECSEEVKASAKALELNVDKCAEATTKAKMGEEEASEETGTLIHVDGKWYLSII